MEEWVPLGKWDYAIRTDRIVGLPSHIFLVRPDRMNALVAPEPCPWCRLQGDSGQGPLFYSVLIRVPPPNPILTPLRS